MAEINKPSLDDIWSEGGAKNEPSSSKIKTGWVSEIPPFATQNWWQNRVDLILKHIFQRGVLSWDPNEEYFQNKSIVNHNGKLYIATTNNDNKVPSSSPS